MSGLDLIRRIKENPLNRTIMCLLSAYRDFSYAREGMTLVVKYYLVKPTSFEEIGETFQKIRKELEDRSLSAEIPRHDHPDTENAAVKRIYSIMLNKTSTCSLDSISGEIGMAVSYISRLFKKETGKNFRDELQTIKMERAAKMLESPAGYTNREISDSLGYQDAQNFCRVFKKRYGMSPGKFRDIHSPS
jgi:YesN/AraC family two-component response regulator